MIVRPVKPAAGRQIMRVLVLGASGMLGHKMLQHLSSEVDVAGTIREPEPDPVVRDALPDVPLYPNVLANDLDALEHAIDDWRADVVVNCIGIVKQAPAAGEYIPSICVNALLPHQLHQLTAARGVRLIHFSTDCVFSGRDGNYTEDDPPDPRDLYGRSKLLGEVTGSGALTLRGSIVGHELRDRRGLIEWFLEQRGGHIKGFARALYTGLTTNAMADRRHLGGGPQHDGAEKNEYRGKCAGRNEYLAEGPGPCDPKSNKCCQDQAHRDHCAEAGPRRQASVQQVSVVRIEYCHHE